MRIDLCGCPVDLLRMDETVARACDAMATRQRLHHVALNTAKFVNMQTDPELAADVKGSDIVGIDGAGIVLALRLFGLPRSERVAGIDLMAAVLEASAQRGFRPYFLGATPAVLRAAVSKIKATYPGLELAGVCDGYFKPGDDEAQVVAAIRASRADCLFVGMPTPRKERFLAAHREALDVPFIMGVGGSFDVWAGHVKRAPMMWQRLGLEWLYRVYQEPGRMWWRYARTNTVFAWLLTKAMLQRRFGVAPDTPARKSLP